MSKKLSQKLSGVAELYSNSLMEHGATPKGVGWTDEDRHQLRFDMLAKVLEGEEENITINDLGCGYGALYGYLEKSGYTIKDYRGYDISEEMLIQAQKALPGDNITFINGAALNKVADYSFASGIFNVPVGHDQDSWQKHIFSTLDDMNAHSRNGFAFNLLSSYVDWKADNLYYADPLLFFDHCKTSFSRYVTLHHDYPLWEWTIVVRKVND